MKQAPQDAADVAGADRAARGELSTEMRTLTGMITTLEGELDRMIEVIDSTNKELEQERQRRLDLEGTVGDLKERLRLSEDDVADKDSVVAEISHLDKECARLSDASRRLAQKLAKREEESKKELGLVARLRAVREDAVDEVRTIEAQFDKAMSKVKEARARLAVVAEERDAVATQLRTTEGKVKEVRQQRAALVAELDESRAALDEIRRSLVDACVVSTGATREVRAGRDPLGSTEPDGSG